MCQKLPRHNDLHSLLRNWLNSCWETDVCMALLERMLIEKQVRIFETTDNWKRDWRLVCSLTLINTYSTSCCGHQMPIWHTVLILVWYLHIYCYRVLFWEPVKNLICTPIFKYRQNGYQINANRTSCCGYQVVIKWVANGYQFCCGLPPIETYFPPVGKHIWQWRYGCPCWCAILVRLLSGGNVILITWHSISSGWYLQKKCVR